MITHQSNLPRFKLPPIPVNEPTSTGESSRPGVYCSFVFPRTRVERTISLEMGGDNGAISMRVGNRVVSEVGISRDITIRSGLTIRGFIEISLGVESHVESPQVVRMAYNFDVCSYQIFCLEPSSVEMHRTRSSSRPKKPRKVMERKRVKKIE